MTNAIRVVHTTRYRYSQPVKFGPHRLLLRPRDGHDLRLVSSAIAISPEPCLRWHFDTFGNSVAIAEFSLPADMLEIRSELLIRRFSHEDFLVSPDRTGSAYPFVYSSEDLIDLAPFIALENPRERSKLAAWLGGDAGKAPGEVFAFLRNLSDSINDRLSYIRRERMGTQSAATTIDSGTGSCRDFAFLFMEAARHFGFAARFVTGYLHTAADDDHEHTGGGSTHAWAEVYLPEEGWVEFDPTNRIIGSPDLIRVAVTRTPYQAIPVSGTYDQRFGTLYHGMEVDVRVASEPYNPFGVL
ncbi:transglutaminase family protein [uncultured Roseibium sp.]|uniref:transglutaminase family protein n=1 Tax=uncultured Roseibium sp. TaxID=1936171 RepID=UPI0032169843